ncbi:MAG: GreA/GreB family elongation factor [Bacillota bacterium]
MTREIMITDADLRRLQDVFCPAAESAPLEALVPELGQARIIPSDDAPPDLVTIDSRLELRDIHTKESQTCTLVCQPEVDGVEQPVSALTPAGLALLGRRVGDCIGWWADSALQMARIDRLLYQREAAGRTDAGLLSLSG